MLKTAVHLSVKSYEHSVQSSADYNGLQTSVKYIKGTVSNTYMMTIQTHIFTETIKMCLKNKSGSPRKESSSWCIKAQQINAHCTECMRRI